MTVSARSPVVLVGHPTPLSRTRSVAVQAGRLLHDRLAADGLPLAPPQLTDLAELAPGLLAHGTASQAAEAAMTTVRQAPLVLVASPTFRGACSGLLKLFLDLLPRYGLASTVAVPLMTAGMPEHRAAVDTSLRPVLLELRADVPAVGICVLEAELPRFEEIFDTWWTRNGPSVRRAVGARTAAQDRVTTC